MIVDIKLAYRDPYFDLGILNNDLETEDSLKTAIIISLFTDRRITQEELPPEEKSLMGCWTDALDEDLIGSKLWLLKRQKITPQVVTQARQYCEEALQWLFDDGIAEQVIVTTERSGLFQLSIEIQIIRPQDSNISQKYFFIWESIKAA